MYIIAAVVYSAPAGNSKQPVWTNKVFVLAIVILFAISFCVTFVDALWIDQLFETIYPYWTQSMDRENDDPLFLESIPKANDNDFPFVRLM